ncbi:MAG TPA: winged helix-turn-helix domain-containing protein [Hyphomonadaceae bacterium]|nr:winged helix-turn-helix domain-containing protein [Hyphomonadaceae bacterium]
MTGPADRNVREFSGFVLDPTRRTLTGPGGVAIELKPRVFDTLAALALRPGEVVSKRDLMETVWPGVVVEENNLSQAISALRKVFGENGRDGRRLIVTVPGRGYQFAPYVIAQESAPSIAVLPFDDISARRDQAHLCRGITDELLAHLRRMKDITIAGGEWVRALMAQDADPRQLAARLSVTHLLEGSVRREGARLRVSARLTGTADGFLIWSEEYDRDLTDLFDTQERIASAVADALRVALAVNAPPGIDEVE